MSEHTPGPWSVEDDGYGEDCHPEEPGKRWLSIYGIDGPEGGEVAVLVNRKTDPTPQQWDNARLIAAAPDLLAACEAALDGLVAAGAVDRGIEQEQDDEYFAEAHAFNVLRAAIRKARGEEA